MNPIEDLEIDPNALDNEWLNIAHLNHQYGEASADAKRDMEGAKEAVDMIMATVGLEIRRNPKKYNLEDKITEGTISATILLDSRVQKAKQVYATKRHEYDVVQSAVWAVKAKESSLENLVKLLQMDYFAGPREPRKLESTDRTMGQQSARSGIRRRLNPNV